MKKWLLMLLAGVLLFSACSETIPEQSSQEESVSEEQGGPYETLVSYGKPYTSSATPNETYTDKFGQQLTDGEKAPNEGAHYIDSRMVAYTSNTIIQIDLGEEDGKRIKKIVARSVEMHTDGVTLASSVRISASNDGKKFQTLGTRPFKETGDQTMSEVELVLDEATDYRYIRVQFFKGSGFFYFIDEIEVYADVAPKKQEDKAAAAYEVESLDRTAWKALSTAVTVNPVDTKVITVGKKYTVKNCTFDERAPKTDVGVLTDGERTGRYFSDNAWLGIVADGEKAPEVTVALEKNYNNISALKVYTCGGGVNVDLPAYIDAYGSKDGEYVFLGRMYAPKEGRNVTYTLLLLEYIEAKNIRFVFPKEAGNYWVEEIQVIAGYNDEQSQVLFDPVTYPKVTEELYWEASEPDYKKEQNLL
ncbi:MAG: discoidin domain-containing protein, partial [Clostridia bacterium]|nr:discoidin domain-containing protein [Clostridia bacterium]